MGHRKQKAALKAPPLAPPEPRWSAVFAVATGAGVTLTTAEARRLRADAAEVWRYALAYVDGLGLASRGDRDALRDYATARAWQAHHGRAMMRDGGVTTGRNGEQVVSPSARLEQRYGAIARGLAQQLGLTPGARQRMTIPDPDDAASAWDDLLDPPLRPGGAPFRFDH